jgi:hypothetical protein
MIITASSKNSFIRTLLLVNYQYFLGRVPQHGGEAQGMPASAKAAVLVFSCQG